MTMTIEQLIHDLRRPLYIYDMALRDSQFDTLHTKAAKKRRDSALIQIDEIVSKYVNSKK